MIDKYFSKLPKYDKILFKSGICKTKSVLLFFEKYKQEEVLKDFKKMLL